MQNSFFREAQHTEPTGQQTVHHGGRNGHRGKHLLALVSFVSFVVKDSLNHDR